MGHASLVQEQQRIRKVLQTGEIPIIRSIPEAPESYRYNSAAQREEKRGAASAERMQEKRILEQRVIAGRREAARTYARTVCEKEKEVVADTRRERERQRARDRVQISRPNRL